MTTPRIEIELAKIEHNTRVLVGRMAVRGIRVTGVTKATLGSPGVGAAMLRGGAVGLGDSRVQNLARLAELDGSPSRMLIRSPQLSQAGQVVQTATASLNTEAAVIDALDVAAAEAGRRHGVILMVELGDLREGITLEDVDAAVGVVLGSTSLRLLGLGANLACQYGVVPDDVNMGTLTRLVEKVEAAHRIGLAVVSGGNSANLEWATTTDCLGRTNNLRMGEAILLGTEPLHRTPIPGLHTDAFTLTAEVIEVADKPEAGEPEVLQVPLREGAKANVEMPRTRRLVVERKDAQAQAGTEAGLAFVRYAEGEGSVTFLADAGFLTNGSIGRHDHAALAWALVRAGRFRGRTMFSGMIYAPLVMPEVITGLSLLLLFVWLEDLIGWPAGRGVTTISIAHITFSMCYVAVVVQSRLHSFDRSIEEAAMDLGCPPARTFFQITLPIIAPAVIAGWLLSFTLSLDDLVIASFTTGPGATTLPMKIYSQVRLGVTPEINAVCTILVGLVATGVLTASLITRRQEMKRESDERMAAADH